ncbi:putative forkhead box J protein, partial [Operophtera brumata]
MHITSGLSPASGELLDPSINFYGDAGDQCGTAYFAIDHTVPESSHTVEIEYVYEQPETYTLQTDIIISDVANESVYAQNKDVSKKIRTKHKPEKMVVDESEGDLTNLTWLQNITNIMQVPEFPIPISPIPPAKPPQPQSTRLENDMANAVTLHLPDFNLGGIQPLQDIDLQAHVGANVIVEPTEPPPLIPEDVLSSLLMTPTEWDDLQLDMLDNYLDGCF